MLIEKRPCPGPFSRYSGPGTAGFSEKERLSGPLEAQTAAQGPVTGGFKTSTRPVWAAVRSRTGLKFDSGTH